VQSDCQCKEQQEQEQELATAASFQFEDLGQPASWMRGTEDWQEQEQAVASQVGSGLPGVASLQLARCS
jgi:hypothetical protein